MTKQERQRQNQQITQLLAEHGMLKSQLRQAKEHDDHEQTEQLSDEMQEINGHIVSVIVDE